MMFHVKPEEGYPSSAAIAVALADACIGVSTAQAILLAKHARLVLETNATTNLTRITEPAAVIGLHIVDSLAFLPLIPPIKDPVLDIGAGAGYPGIPLAVMGYHVNLCESVKKKAAFLLAAVGELDLPCEVFPLRAEELAAVRREAHMTVVARALSSLPSLVELASPLLPVGGRLVALKGTPRGDEEREADGAAALCGMSLVDRHSYALPGGEARSVFVYERTKAPRVRLPRRPGMAQRHPLTDAHLP